MRWFGRVAMAALAPLILLAGAEVILRWTGYGIDPRFVIGGPGRWHDNPDVGALWFEPGLARSPMPFVVGPKTNQIRIAMVGESAAMGDPAPAFGIATYLQAVLEWRHPGRSFEVVNAAMTAIDSSIIVGITRELAPLKPDAVIVYMGNNEVVGPFGPADGHHSSYRLDAWFARVSLWVRGLRTGQLIRNVIQRPQDAAGRSWQGLELFASRTVPANSPALDTIHRRFQTNLDAILAAIRACGAEPVIGTMATRLNWPPFDRDKLVDTSAAEKLESEGKWYEVYAIYRKLAENEPLSAEWQYRLARAKMATGDIDGGIALYLRSRDLDQLRFRADSRINDAVRKRAESAPAFRDIELQFNELFADQDMFFWDHVHLTPEGNFAAATSFAAALEPILATRGLSPQRATPSWDELSDRVILTDWDRLNASVAMHTRMLRPPFDSLGTHHEIVGRLTREITALRKRVTRENVEMIRDKLQVAAQAHPDDFHLLSRLGRLFEELGQYPQSLDVQEIMMRTWPHVRSVRSAYGRALVRAGRVEDGLRELEQGEIPGTLRPRLIALIEASSVLAEMGRIDEAIGLLDRALALEPAYAKALHNRAIIYSRTGRDAEAEADYKEAVRIDPGLVESLNNLAVMAIRRNNLEQAESYLREAVRQHPLHISSLRNLSLVTMKRGDWETAFACSSKLSYLDPEFEDIAQMQKVPAKP